MYEKYVALRDKKKLSDYKVSQMTGITKSTFTDWKNGKSKPKIDKLQKIANYFGVEITYFLKD
ncbi:MAG: helix-turn-helix transcriptional regulator [Lachnospiraceae bacterium]|nr:helix-turn-helix transcriptional regulator [Lachnospiraceae bacterium]